LFDTKDFNVSFLLLYVFFFIFLCSDNSREVSTEVLKSTRDMYGKSQKERMDNLDQANQEIDRLRKQLDKLQVELQGEY
jgi:polyhydroxyalkanoate synthesis regulator phasin